jgi:outer membrane immunogenic protein
MKKILIATAIAASCITPQAFAQAKNFEGFSVAGNVNLISATTEISVPGASLNGVGQQATTASLQAAYSFVLTDVFLLSLGGTYNLADVDAGTATVAPYSGAFKLQKGASLYVEPGYALSDKTLAYAKVSYNTGTLKAEESGASITKDINGAGVGFGFRTLLSKNLFLQVEASRIQFNSARFDGDVVDFKTGATVGSVGIGYKF